MTKTPRGREHLPTASEIRDTIDRLLDGRAAEVTICPSEVARALAPTPDWRELMEPVRDVAVEQHAAGRLEIKQRGERVDDPSRVRGPIRLGRPQR